MLIVNFNNSFFSHNHFIVNLSFIDASFKKFNNEKILYPSVTSAHFNIVISMIIFYGSEEVTKMDRFLN